MFYASLVIELPVGIYMTISPDISLKGEVCFLWLSSNPFAFAKRLGEFLCMFRCDREVAICQPPLPVAASQGTVPSD